MSRTAVVLRDSVILNNRYQIVKQIGRGDRGRTYLAEDIHRYRELCVLQEFVERVESDRQLHKLTELFNRQVGMLSRIAHPQIPRLDPLLQTMINGERSLFIVQQHIEGSSYWQLLQDRGNLSEVEVTKMLWEVLAILDHTHSFGLIHGNISPYNIIVRELDCRSVLINFSCIKRIIDTVSGATKHSTDSSVDRDYCPDEQIRYHRATRCSELYSLAVTAVVLLTGKQPRELYDSHHQKWNWKKVKVSRGLQKVLSRMLAAKPCDRYQSADRVRQALAEAESSLWRRFGLRLLPTGSLRFKNYASQKLPYNTAANKTSRQATTVTTSNKRTRIKPWQWGVISAGITGISFIPGLISFTLIRNQLAPPVVENRGMTNVSERQKEQDLQQNIYRRLELLEIDAGAFFRQVDTIFYSRYPELKGVSLSESAEHQSYRQIWYQIASKLLQQWEQGQ